MNHFVLNDSQVGRKHTKDLSIHFTSILYANFRSNTISISVAESSGASEIYLKIMIKLLHNSYIKFPL